MIPSYVRFRIETELNYVANILCFFKERDNRKKTEIENLCSERKRGMFWVSILSRLQ